MVFKSICVAAVLGALATAAAAEPAFSPEIKRYTAYTPGITLRQGEVSNGFHTLQIPKGPIAVFRFEADVVEKNAQGEFVPVPVYDAYLHHHVVGSNHKAYEKTVDQWAPMKPQSFTRSVGFAAGTESRGTPQQFQYPYAFVTVEGEDEWVANVHVINSRNLTDAQARKCHECPCTSEDVFTNETVNGMPFNLNGCNADLLAESNTCCTAETYYGGLRCCEDNSFCLEKSDVLMEQTSTYYLRYAFEYSEVLPDIRPLYLAGCCDASGDFNNHGNVEFDVPACDPELHPGCVHTLSTRQYLDVGKNIIFAAFLDYANDEAQDHDVEIVFAVGHQHRGGLGMAVYNDATGDLICNSVPKYGKSDVIGDEKDYVVAMSTCTFDPPLRMKSSDVIRVVSLYNNTLPQSGAMSLMYLAVSAVDSNAQKFISATKAKLDSAESTTADEQTASAGFWSSPFAWAAVVAVVAGGVVVVVLRKKARQGYVPVSRPN